LSTAEWIQFGNDGNEQHAWEGKYLFNGMEDKVQYRCSSMCNVRVAVNVSHNSMMMDFPRQYYDKETYQLEEYKDGDKMFLYMLL
jgi:hypothetical protein